MELIEGLETSSDLHGDQAAGSLIDLLTDESSLRKTSLGLLARARLIRLKGWLLRSTAGTDPAHLYEVGKVLDHAHALAVYCVHREERRRAEEALRNEQQGQARETLVLTTQARVLAGLVQSRCWHRLFGVFTLPWTADQAWEAFVAPENRASAESLWSLCGLDCGEEPNPKRSGIPAKVLAIALRVLALYSALREGTTAPGRASWLCLWAAKFNQGLPDCRARNLLEAAILLPDDSPIEDLWGLTSPGTLLTREFLRRKAMSLFEPERERHPGLAPYMDLLNMILDGRRRGDAPPYDAAKLGELKSEFERTGEGYFAELVRDMSRHPETELSK